MKKEATPAGDTVVHLSVWVVQELLGGCSRAFWQGHLWSPASHPSISPRISDNRPSGPAEGAKVHDFTSHRQEFTTRSQTLV